MAHIATISQKVKKEHQQARQEQSGNKIDSENSQDKEENNQFIYRYVSQGTRTSTKASGAEGTKSSNQRVWGEIKKTRLVTIQERIGRCSGREHPKQNLKEKDRTTTLKHARIGLKPERSEDKGGKILREVSTSITGEGQLSSTNPQGPKA